MPLSEREKSLVIVEAVERYVFDHLRNPETEGEKERLEVLVEFAQNGRQTIAELALQELETARVLAEVEAPLKSSEPKKPAKPATRPAPAPKTI